MDVPKDTKIIDGFVRFPDEYIERETAMANPLFCDVHAVGGDDLSGVFISSRLREFEETGNPVLALEAYVASIDAGVYPPLRLLRWLACGLTTYHDSQGTIPLDKALGFSVGRGKTPYYKRLLMDERDDMLMHDVDLLMYLGASREAAAHAVIERLKGSDWNKSKHDMDDISAITLEDRHKRASRPNIDCESALLLGIGDKKGVSDFLKKFNLWDLPDNLKSAV